MIRIIIIVIIIINNCYQLDYMQVRRPKTWCRFCGKAHKQGVLCEMCKQRIELPWGWTTPFRKSTRVLGRIQWGDGLGGQPPPFRTTAHIKKLIQEKTSGNTWIPKIQKWVQSSCMQMQNHQQRCSWEIFGAAPYTNDGVFTFG